MLKENKWKAIISSAVILLPVLVGIILWNDLPGNMVVHWDMSGTPDGQGVKAGVVIGMPLLLLALHWLCILTTGKDRGNKDQSKKVFGMLFWIMPVLSLFVSGITYTTAFGWNVDIKTIMGILLGLLFVVMGNYMPKCKRNYTIGIKVRWALADDENWAVTHRFAGKVYVICGLLMMICGFIPEEFMIFVLLAIAGIGGSIPAVYSWQYYKKQAAAGKVPLKAELPEQIRKVQVPAIIAIIVVVAAIIVFVFAASGFEVLYGEESFTIDARLSGDVTLQYSVIDSIELRENGDAGARTFGYGSPGLLMGNFQNDEFGYYVRYAWTKPETCVVLKSGENTLVLNGKDDAATEAIYEELCTRCGK